MSIKKENAEKKYGQREHNEKSQTLERAEKIVIAKEHSMINGDKVWYNQAEV